MSREQKSLKVTPVIKHQLDNLPITVSAAVVQAIVNANDDDNLVVRALKRRMALPPTKEKNDQRLCVMYDPRISNHLENLTAKSGLATEQVLRLAIEAYLYRL
jgi:hypothetical protein